jgi:isopentenyldiphosphate isomerase
LEELIQIWSKNGKPTQEICTKNTAHQMGYFHATVHVWFYNELPALLLQKRGSLKETYPNLWDVSVAGHVTSGESITAAAVRETNEEIGLKINPDDLTLLKIRRNTNRFSNGIIDCEFQHVFLHPINFEMEDLKLQRSEIEAVRLFNFEELKCCTQRLHQQFSIVPADMSYYHYIMEEVSKRI